MSLEMPENEHFEITPEYVIPKDESPDAASHTRIKWVARHLTEFTHGLTSLVEQAGSWRHKKMSLHAGVILLKQAVHLADGQPSGMVRFKAIEVVPVAAKRAKHIAYVLRELSIDRVNRRLHPIEDVEPVVVVLPGKLGEGARPEDFRFSVGSSPEGEARAGGEVAQVLALYSEGEAVPHDLHAVIAAQGDTDLGAA